VHCLGAQGTSPAWFTHVRLALAFGNRGQCGFHRSPLW
jgi:hypothetical protein